MSLLKEHIRNMVKGIINEYNSPDHIFLYKDGGEQKLGFRDNDAIGFFLRGNGDFYCGKAMTHSELKYDYIANKLGFKTNDEYNDYIDNNPGIESEALEEEFEAIENDIMSRGSECIEGRYWCNNNIIAFWYEVPQFEEFKKIINGIASFIHSNININDVTIAVDDFDLMFAKDYFSNGSDKYNNIDKEKSEELRALHLMNAEEKAQTSQMKDYLQNKSENTGKKLKYNNSKGEMPMAQWRALHSTSENKTIKYNNKMRITKKDIKKAINEAFSDLVQHNHLMADYDFDDYDEDDYKYMSDEDIASQYEDFEITHLEAEPARYGEGFTGTIEITFPNADDVDYNSTTVDNFFVYDDNLTKFGFENWYPEDVVEKLKMEIRDYINKNLKKTTALESKIRQIVQETVCEIGQRYNGEYDRTGLAVNDDEYVESLDYIIDSIINGNHRQAQEMISQLSPKEIKELILLAREMGCEEEVMDAI